MRPLHRLKFTSFIPTGSTSLSIEPAEGKAESGEKDKMRNEEAREADR